MVNWATDSISTSQAAKIVGHNPATIWRWWQRHPQLAIKVGGRLAVNRKAIELIAQGLPLDQAAARAWPQL